jgi:hypothetical protein
MDINRTCSLVLKDVYSYDIPSCHYIIMKKMGFDMSKIPADDKLERNTQIGLMMRENPKITSMLRTITNSTISEYLTRNEISEDELILRAYDGVITTKAMYETTTQYVPIALREMFEILIISSDRQKYIGRSHRTVIKGISHRYDRMDEMFTKLVTINFASKKDIFETLQKIRDNVVEGNDIDLYCIPVKKDKFNIFLMGYGETEISKGIANLIEVDDIDKERYYDFYLRSFCESITLEFA